MARLTFETPDSKYCHWDTPPCLAFKERNFYCSFFGEFLEHDGTAHVKCEQCLRLGKNGTATKE